MLDAAPFQHGFQSVPLLRVDRPTRTPPSPPARARRNQTLVCASAAFRPRPWRPSRGASTARSPASGYPGRARSGGSANRRRDRAQSVVLPAPAGTVTPCSAAGGLFEAEPCHRRWSRSRSVLPPAAPSTLRRKARSLFEELPAGSPVRNEQSSLLGSPPTSVHRPPGRGQNTISMRPHTRRRRERRSRLIAVHDSDTRDCRCNRRSRPRGCRFSHAPSHRSRSPTTSPSPVPQSADGHCCRRFCVHMTTPTTWPTSVPPACSAKRSPWR